MDDPEVAAMALITKALASLSDEQKANVLLYLNARYGGHQVPVRRQPASSSPRGSDPNQFDSLGDFFDALDPQTEADRVLALGYWLQVVRGAADFESFPVNKELKNLGHPVSNITRALETLISQTPRLALQIGKSGSSKQARKKYKITREGIKRVEAALGQNNGEGNGA